MTAAQRGTRPIRIGSSSGFYGDRATALEEMASGGGVDVIIGDYLAEVTMLILGKAREKDPGLGYATTFLRHLEPALADVAAKDIRIVVNAGGLNPAGLAAATRKLVAANGLDLRVSHVEGDNIVDRLDALQADGNVLPHLQTGQALAEWAHAPITANAYLGGFGIARALAGGADIVVTGRVADASLVLGSAAWWWEWEPGDHGPLAGGIVAGHVIECGPQATGGNFSDFTTINRLRHPGFPIAEVARDGSSVITKPEGTDGAVNIDTVTAQLMYEIGGPEYLNADVTTHLDSVVLTDFGDDRVGIGPVRGTAPPSTTKVAITGLGGWESTNYLVLTGLHQDEKASLAEEAIRSSGAADGLDELVVERIGIAAENAVTQSTATSFLRVTARGDRHAAGRAFSAHLVELALANFPGLYFLGPPSSGSSYGEYWPALVEQRVLEHCVVHHHGGRELVPPPEAPENEIPQPGPLEDSATSERRADESVRDPSVALVEVPLASIALARSGDKGGDANVGIWARSEECWPWLRSQLTIDELRRLAPEVDGLDIERDEFANLHAVNFVIHGLLCTGATSSHRLDRQAKALGEWILSRTVRLPASFMEPSYGMR
jgi:hypothetical protein